MSAIALPAGSGPFGSASGWGELLRRRRHQPPTSQNGSRLWLIPMTVWLAVMVLAALSNSVPGACHGTTEALRQQLSYQV